MDVPYSDILNKKNYNLASWMYERVVNTINDFEKDIRDDEQASIVVSSFANNPILINDVSYWNPDIIIFDGVLVSDGSTVQVLQHTSQLNLCLIASKRRDPERPRRKIGFSVDSQED